MHKVSGSSEVGSKCKKHKKHKKHSKHKLKRRAKERGLYVSVPSGGNTISTPPNSESEWINKDILAIAKSITKKVLHPECASDLSDLELFRTPTKKPVQCPTSQVYPTCVSDGLNYLTTADVKKSKVVLHWESTGCGNMNEMRKKKPHAMSSSDSDSEIAQRQTEVQLNKKSKRASASKITTNVEISSEIPSGCPEGMTVHTFTSENTPCWLEDVTADGKELWLVKVPDNFEPDKLDGIQVQLDGAVKLPTSQITDSQYEALSRPMNSEMGSLSVLLPSHKRSALCLAPALVRQLEIIQTLPGEGANLPSPVRPKNMTLPEGLQYRNVPFGSESPERLVDVLSPERKLSKRKLEKALGTSFFSPKRRKGVSTKDKTVDETDLAMTSKDGKKKRNTNGIVIKEEPSASIDNELERKKDKKKKKKDKSAVEKRIVIKDEPSASIDNKQSKNGIVIKEEPSASIDNKLEQKKDKKKDKSAVEKQNIKQEMIETAEESYGLSESGNPWADVSGSKKKKKHKNKDSDEMVEVKMEIVDSGDTADGCKKKKKKHKNKDSDGMVEVKMEVVDSGDTADGCKKKKQKKHKNKDSDEMVEVKMEIDSGDTADGCKMKKKKKKHKKQKEDR